MAPVLFFWNYHDGNSKQCKEVEDDEPLEDPIAGEQDDGAHGFSERHREGTRDVAALVKDDVE